MGSILLNPGVYENRSNVNKCNVSIPRVQRRYCDVYTQIKNILTYIH